MKILYFGAELTNADRRTDGHDVDDGKFCLTLIKFFGFFFDQRKFCVFLKVPLRGRIVNTE